MGGWGRRFEKPPGGFIGFAAEGPSGPSDDGRLLPWDGHERRHHQQLQGPDWPLIGMLAAGCVLLGLAGLGLWKLVELLGG